MRIIIILITILLVLTLFMYYFNRILLKLSTFTEKYANEINNNQRNYQINNQMNNKTNDQNNNKNEGVSLFNYQDIMLKNQDHDKIYRPRLKLEELKYDDCERQCDATDCIKMREKKKVLDRCIKCKAEGKCFKKSIIGGTCNDCQQNEAPMDCLRTDNFGCTNPMDFTSFNGSYPYYFELQDYNVNSIFDQRCVFCWQIEDQI